jgi:quinol monooxygenase YgiN
MGIMVIVGYRPKPGQEAALLAEVRAHVPTLRAEGLATDRPALAMRAADGTIIEVFEWLSREAIEKAHGNPAVQEMWERFGACCDYVPVAALEEAQQLFSEFTPVRVEPPFPAAGSSPRP